MLIFHLAHLYSKWYSRNIPHDISLVETHRRSDGVHEYCTYKDAQTVRSSTYTAVRSSKTRTARVCHAFELTLPKHFLEQREHIRSHKAELGERAKAYQPTTRLLYLSISVSLRYSREYSRISTWRFQKAFHYAYIPGNIPELQSATTILYSKRISRITYMGQAASIKAFWQHWGVAVTFDTVDLNNLWAF